VRLLVLDPVGCMRGRKRAIASLIVAPAALNI
jgi:hypothetical protein